MATPIAISAISMNLPALITKLHTNLICIEAPFKLTRSTIFKLLGNFSRLARSMCLLSENLALVDIVPIHEWNIETLLKYTGQKFINGFSAQVQFTRARASVSCKVIYDYAHMLIHATAPGGCLNPAYFYPNENWECPPHLLPIVDLPSGSFDPAIRKAALDVKGVTLGEAYPAPNLLN